MATDGRSGQVFNPGFVYYSLYPSFLVTYLRRPFLTVLMTFDALFRVTTVIDVVMFTIFDGRDWLSFPLISFTGSHWDCNSYLIPAVLVRRH